MSFYFATDYSRPQSALLRQIGAADIVLINKADIAPAEDLKSLQSLIRSLNPTASIEVTVRGVLDLSKILNLHAYTSKPEFYDQASAHQDEHEHDEHCSHSHFGDITSLLIPLPVGADSGKIDEWIRTILWEGHLPSPDEAHKIEVLRCKGLWWGRDGAVNILQGVRSLYETTQHTDRESPREGKLVLIGKNLGNNVTRNFNLHI